MAHSRKVLSQAGFSLADVYDVQGSIVGIEELEVSEVKAVHDLGPQIHSERLTTFIQINETVAVGQNTAFSFLSAGHDDAVARVLGYIVFANVAGRVDRVCVGIQDPDTLREMPFFVWNTANDRESAFEWSEDGAAIATFVQFNTLATQLPSLVTRMGINRTMPRFILRGDTSGFGAGTVQIFMAMYIAFPNPVARVPGDPSSHGLPIPSW